MIFSRCLSQQNPNKNRSQNTTDKISKHIEIVEISADFPLDIFNYDTIKRENQNKPKLLYSRKGKNPQYRQETKSARMRNLVVEKRQIQKILFDSA